MQVEFGLVTDEQIVFTLSNADVSFANALRRIMLAEVPSMAIEYVDILCNDSPMHDEVLAHRLSLLPLRADAANFEPCASRSDVQLGRNALEFTLDFTGTSKRLTPDGSCHVLSKHMLLTKTASAASASASKVAMAKDSSEEDENDEDGKLGMLLDDIMVMKLKPGQKLKLKCYAVRGIGAKHTKFSPVCTASYRATPSITIAQQPEDKATRQALVDLCPRQVFDIEDSHTVVVSNPGACSMCRQCTIDPKLNGERYVDLGRVKDSFIFSVETLGAVPPAEIVQRALAILKHKCEVVKDEMDNLEDDAEDDAEDAPQPDAMDVDL